MCGAQMVQNEHCTISSVRNNTPWNRCWSARVMSARYSILPGKARRRCNFLSFSLMSLCSANMWSSTPSICTLHMFALLRLSSTFDTWPDCLLFFLLFFSLLLFQLWFAWCGTERTASGTRRAICERDTCASWNCNRSLHAWTTMNIEHCACVWAPARRRIKQTERKKKRSKSTATET